MYCTVVYVYCTSIPGCIGVLYRYSVVEPVYLYSLVVSVYCTCIAWLYLCTVPLYLVVSVYCTCIAWLYQCTVPVKLGFIYVLWYLYTWLYLCTIPV